LALLRHPEYLVAGILALVPLLVYGVPYLRVRERVFPALHFLLRRYPTRFQRFRFQNRVLIAVRTVLVLVVVALFAMPSAQVITDVPAAPPSGTGLLLVVSDSVEMSRTTPEGTHLDLARRRAATWLEQSDKSNFLVAGTCRGLPEDAEWGDRSQALAALRDLRQAWTWCPVGPVVEAARRRWAPDSVEIVVLREAELPEPAGATLLEASIRDDVLRVVAALRGTGAALTVRCRGEGEPGAATELAGPGTRAVELTPSASCAGGWWEVSLSPDGLDAGDSVWVPVPARPVMDVLLVDGGFGGRLEDRRTRFLEPALRSLDCDETPLRVRVLSQEELTAKRIEAADLVVLADPHPLRTHLRRALALHLEAGGGLITTAGPRLARWERGLGVLPGAWRTADISESPGPALELPAGGTAELVRAVQAQGRSIRMRRRLILSGIAGGDADTVVSFDDGVPAVVRWRRSGGTGFLWAVSADLSFGELPLHAAFPLILGGQVREVAARLRTSMDAQRCTVGTPCEVASMIPPGWDLLDRGGGTAADLVDRLTRGDGTLEPGPYTLRRGDERRLLAILDLPCVARRALSADAAPREPAHARRPPPAAPAAPLRHRTPVRSRVALLAMILLMLEGWVALRQ